MTRLFDQLNHIDLLFKEKRKEMVLIWASRQQLLEGVLVLLPRIEGRGKTGHEDFTELAVARVDNTFQLSIVLLKVWSNQIRLHLALPEALDFEAVFHERVTRVYIDELIPKALLELRAG